MSDISKITLPDNSSYDIKDATARSKLNVLTNNLATCATGRSTAAKVATLANFSLNAGATIAVKFTDTAGTANPASGNLTLNVNGTGAKNIGYFRNGNKAALTYSSGGYFYNNQTHIFTYDGTYWLCMDWNADNNTDTKVTSVGNHYTPVYSTTKSANGDKLADITHDVSGLPVVTGVEIDAKGHVTGVESLAIKITVDSDLDGTSINPVENKAVVSALAGMAKEVGKKADYDHTHIKQDITDLPLISNPNLLINPGFKINQRGILGTFSEVDKYFVDRWRLVSGTVTVNTDGTITLNGSICQPLENAAMTNVTASVSAGTAAYDYITQTFTITGSGDVILWAKLEYGDITTPFIARDPVEELRKCQRYYRVITNTIIQPYVYHTNLLAYFIPINDMRDNVTPTVEISGTINDFSGIVIYNFYSGNKVGDINTIDASFQSGWGVMLYVNTAFNPSGLSGTLRIADGAKITIDAEIY